jgi:hypothetical protein
MLNRILDTLAKHGFWLPCWLMAFGFVDAIWGGIYRASEGGDLAGFFPTSLYSALIFVFGVFTMVAVRENRPSALVWAILASLVCGLRFFVSPDQTGPISDYGPLMMTFAIGTIAMLVAFRVTGRTFADN